MIDRVKANSKIEIHWNTKVEKANGTDWLENVETTNSQKGSVEIKVKGLFYAIGHTPNTCLLYTSPSPRDMRRSRMPSSA